MLTVDQLKLLKCYFNSNNSEDVERIETFAQEILKPVTTLFSSETAKGYVN